MFPSKTKTEKLKEKAVDISIESVNELIENHRKMIVLLKKLEIAIYLKARPGLTLVRAENRKGEILFFENLSYEEKDMLERSGLLY